MTRVAKSLSLLTWSWEALRKILEVKVLTGKILSRKGLTLEAIWLRGKQSGGDEVTTNTVTS
ncbi:MAG: hypothetical protein DMG89_12490 [Acidobacteria bacterium]|nr:MAG: hypothetical protein DMG89_12490 [Acidobacteriota bacterium]